MADTDDDYVYDEVTGEWRPASELAATKAAAAVVRIAGRDGFQDDPFLTNAVYSTLTLQLDGVWWTE